MKLVVRECAGDSNTEKVIEHYSKSNWKKSVIELTTLCRFMGMKVQATNNNIEVCAPDSNKKKVFMLVED